VTIRKRRNPTFGFNIPPPYQPITGERAPLVNSGDYPYCAMFQVAADDEYDDYVICRGYDPRTKRFIDYDAEDENKPGIPVAKPFSNRTAGVYTVGELYPAVIPLTQLGQNSGVAAETQGQPADLDEAVEILYTDDESKVVTWLLLDSGSSRSVHLCTLGDDLEYNDTTGITVTLLQGGTIDNVLPPPGMPTGTKFPSGAYAVISQMRDANGDFQWYAVPCSACPEEIT
jgi:hypothetical protein